MWHKTQLAFQLDFEFFWSSNNWVSDISMYYHPLTTRLYIRVCAIYFYEIFLKAKRNKLTYQIWDKVSFSDCYYFHDCTVFFIWSNIDLQHYVGFHFNEYTHTHTHTHTHVKVKSLSHVWLFATPWTVDYQAPLSMGFSRQEYWSRLPLPSAGDLPNPGIRSNLGPLHCRQTLYHLSHQGSLYIYMLTTQNLVSIGHHIVEFLYPFTSG